MLPELTPPFQPVVLRSITFIICKYINVIGVLFTLHCLVAVSYLTIVTYLLGKL